MGQGLKNRCRIATLAIAMQVLGYLSVGELCTVSLVCRGFLNLSR